jgi:hypothetical protein
MLLILFLFNIFNEILTKTNSQYHAAVKSLAVKDGNVLNQPTTG